MSIISNFFNYCFYQPLFNFLILIYKLIPGGDFGISIIILTILIKLLLLPFNNKAIKSQKIITDLQPKIKEIQEKYKNDKEKQAKEMMEIYKKEKISPFAGIIPALIQLPILIALYQLFLRGFNTEQMSLLYNFNHFSGEINPYFLGIINLSKPNYILAIIVGVLQFFQLKTSTPKKSKNNKPLKKSDRPDISYIIQKETLFIVPLFTVFILLTIPSAVGIYLLTTTLFTIIQQYSIFKNRKNIN